MQEEVEIKGKQFSTCPELCSFVEAPEEGIHFGDRRET